MTAEELVCAGLCDPVRVFVKGEPHKIEKLNEGRYRLIMSVSLVDQLVARVLFQAQNKRELLLWRAIPSKPGFGLSTDAQASEFIDILASDLFISRSELLEHHERYVVPTDCSGFDWSVAPWIMEDEMEVRNRLTVGCTDLTRQLRACWLKCLMNSVLAFSNGALAAQRVPGIQKSGSYNTSSSNSRVRVMMAYHTGASFACAMGDDALESREGSLEMYQSLGLKITRSSELEFCSHIFTAEGKAVPVNVGKMLYRLIYGYDPERGTDETRRNYFSAVAAVTNELRHVPGLESILTCLLPAGAQNIPIE